MMRPVRLDRYNALFLQCDFARGRQLKPSKIFKLARGASMSAHNIHQRNPFVYIEVVLKLLLSILGFFILTSCPATSMRPSDYRQIEGLLSQAPGGADDFIIVDCVLPGQIRQLGTRMVYVTRGPSRKLAAGECARLGGRFALPGQTQYQKALLVWMPDAKTGNKIAQNYVGEIYQRGMGGSPRYDLAAEWYRKAADQGLVRAQMNLAYLYDKGLGVKKDARQAQYWYRRATGLGDAVALDGNALSLKERQELERLREDVVSRSKESKQLRQQLEQTQKNLEEIRRRLNQRQNEPRSRKGGQDVEQLTTLGSQYQATINDLQGRLAEYDALIQKLPPPRIEVHDDLPPLTRGVRYDTGHRKDQKQTVAGVVFAPAGLDTFTVNQRPYKVKPDGKFRFSVSLNPPGDTKVVLVAIDRRGKRTTITHSLSADAVKGGFDTEVYKTIDYGRYHALIIGNIDYQFLPKLLTAVNDAKAIDLILRTKYGFNTKLLLDANRYKILEALNYFKKVLKEKDNFLIYYAGHGHMDIKTGRGYWQPVDADATKTTNWIANYDVTDLLYTIKARHVLVIADSCYSGTLLRGEVEPSKMLETSEARWEYIREINKGRARKVLTSGELEPVLDIGRGGHSVFANVLLDVLKKNNRVIEGDFLHQEMKTRVVRDSRWHGMTQMPLYSGNNQAGDGPGDFIFVPVTYQ